MKASALLCAASLVLLGSPLHASQELADQYRCSWCHAMDRKTVGPSIHDIAKRYAGRQDAAPMLYEKVLKGGGGPWHGAWGTVPMPPNPDIRYETTKAIVDWMLQQKKRRA